MTLLYGYCVLAVAILANVLANALGLVGWYDFLRKNYDSLTALSLVWLFIIYPFLLGLVFYLIMAVRGID